MNRVHLVPHLAAPETLCGGDARPLACAVAVLNEEATLRAASLYGSWACSECMAKHRNLRESFLAMKAGAKPWTLAVCRRADALLVRPGSLEGMSAEARAERRWWLERMTGRDYRQARTAEALSLPAGMTKHQVATACLCRLSAVTPAYSPPGEHFQGQPRRWHTANQCGYFESGKLPTVAISRGMDSEVQWCARLQAAYPVIRLARIDMRAAHD